MECQQARTVGCGIARQINLSRTLRNTGTTGKKGMTIIPVLYFPYSSDAFLGFALEYVFMG